MFTVAYLANRFPAAVEPYVGDEIQELRRRGVQVIPSSVRRPDRKLHRSQSVSQNEILCLQPIRILTLLRAFTLVLWHWKRIASLISRVILQGKEPLNRRLKALVHTGLGAYYAAKLRKHAVNHIHVHHGYFGSWIAMVASRLLDVSYSVTLHGSDLLVDGAYLDKKLEYCRFCATISEYNRSHILKHFPVIDPAKVSVLRLGVDVPECSEPPPAAGGTLNLLAVGRLHAVKDHAFLVRSCARLRDRGLNFECVIAGDGPERHSLELLIRENRLETRLALLGYIDRSQMDSLYRRADIVVLTSRSEGIPLVLMEAMVRNRIVLAPAITGIPEIVIPGKTGFLYRAGALEDFVEKILFLHRLMRRADSSAVSPLDWIRHAARVQVLHNFNRSRNLSLFADRFLQSIATPHSS